MFKILLISVNILLYYTSHIKALTLLSQQNDGNLSFTKKDQKALNRCNVACGTYYSCPNTSTCMIGYCSDDGVCFNFNASCIISNNIILAHGTVKIDCNLANGLMSFSLASLLFGYILITLFSFI